MSDYVFNRVQIKLSFIQTWRIAIVVFEKLLA